MEEIPERISGDELGGSFRECHRASSRELNISTDEAFIISSGNMFQYTKTEGLLATLVLTVLLVLANSGFVQGEEHAGA